MRVRRFLSEIAIANGMVLVAAGAGPAMAWAAAAGAAGETTALGRSARVDVTVRPAAVPTGILYDRVLPLSDIEAFDGGLAARTATLEIWRQILHELGHGALGEVTWPDAAAIVARARQTAAPGVVPVGILDFEYARQAVPGQAGAGYTVARAFAVAPLFPSTHRGASVRFAFDRAGYAGNLGRVPRALAADLDDGRGWRTVAFGGQAAARYATTGRKRVQVRATLSDGEVATGSFYFEVLSLVTPSPDDTLHVTAAIPYQGIAGTGAAYVYYGLGHTSLVKPVIVLEGFDLDNNMNWDELYQLLNGQNLLETLRSEGYDTVVLNFDDATDYMQRNAQVAATLIQEVHAAAGPASPLVVIGASMGGIVGRFALADLERRGLEHGVSLFITFDAPHRGANIPLGVQYWMQFFAGQSAEAAHLDERLRTPAARQLLVYHATVPPGASAGPDPLRPQFLADLAAAGGDPERPRRVAIANGSGAGLGQGFAPGAQLIRYEYTSFLVDIIGNVWAVGAGPSTQVFRGVIDYLFPPPEEQLVVTVSGTQPYDSAPGGWRSSMAQMDSSQTSYGDIVALYRNHCFIPTTSALDLDVADLFHDIDGDPALQGRTLFHAVYFPAANQEHVLLTAENAQWFLSEIRGQAVDAPFPSPAAGRLALHPNVPNPFNPSTRLDFELPQAGRAELAVFDVQGRHVATLAMGTLGAGRHRAIWDGRTASGTRAPSGVYVARLTAPGGSVARRLVLVQ